MSESTKVIPTRTIVLYPNTRGFAYAVMESPLELIDWKVYELKKMDTNRILSKMREIIVSFAPATLVLEDTNCSLCRKGAQTKQIIRTIAAWAKKSGTHVEFYSRKQVRDVFERWHSKTKYEISEVICKNIPELENLLYEKPKYPNRGKNIDALFCAVSFGVTRYFQLDFGG